MSIYFKLCCNISIVICNLRVQCYMCDWMDERINQTDTQSSKPGNILRVQSLRVELPVCRYDPIIPAHGKGTFLER
jgi:hypothetical protein